MNVVERHPSTEGQKCAKLVWGIGLLALALPSVVLAETLTENRAIELGLGQLHFNQLLESQEDAARGNSLTTQTWQNPELGLSREKLGDETETSIWLHQRFDISGQRKLTKQASIHELSAVEAANQVARIERKNQIRSHFYQLLFQQQQRQLFNHWVEKFSTVEAAMEKREAAGDVSGYDRRRISRERVLLMAEQRSIEAEYYATKDRMSGLLGQDDFTTLNDVEGSLAPDALPPLESLVQGLEKHPVFTDMRLQGEAARLYSQAAARSHIPEVTLGIGQKRVEGAGSSDSGLMLSASVPLPFFDRKRGQRQRFAAEAAQAESKYQLTLQQTQADLRALWHKARQLNENSQLFKAQSVSASYELVRIAEAAYHANEIGVLELIDAYRITLDTETNALKLTLQARTARLELDKIIEGIQL